MKFLANFFVVQMIVRIAGGEPTHRAHVQHAKVSLRNSLRTTEGAAGAEGPNKVKAKQNPGKTWLVRQELSKCM